MKVRCMSKMAQTVSKHFWKGAESHAEYAIPYPIFQSLRYKPIDSSPLSSIVMSEAPRNLSVDIDIQKVNPNTETKMIKKIMH